MLYGVTDDAARARCHASKITYGYLPQWFRRRLIHAFGLSPSLPNNALVFQRAVKRITLDGPLGERHWLASPAWFYQFGTTNVDGVCCFCLEPYWEYPLLLPAKRAFPVPFAIAKVTNCRLLALPDGQFGHQRYTQRIRLLFMPGCLFPSMRFSSDWQPRAIRFGRGRILA